MTGSSIEGFFALLRRELGATDVALVDDGEAPDDPTRARRSVGPGRALEVVFAAPPDAPTLERLDLLVASFDALLASAAPPPAKVEDTRTLREELADLATAAGAEHAVVIDARSPVVWGTTRDEPFTLVPDATAPSPLRIAPEVMGLVPRAVCDRRRLVPIARAGDKVVVAMADPGDEAAVLDVVRTTRLAVEPVLASERAIALAVSWHYPRDARTYEEVLAAALGEDEARAIERRTGGAQWSFPSDARRAVDAVRKLPGLAKLAKGGQLVHAETIDGLAIGARSFAGIYVLVLATRGAFDELRTMRAIVAHLPAIERKVLALPPLDPPPRLAGVMAMRRRRRR